MIIAIALVLGGVFLLAKSGKQKLTTTLNIPTSLSDANGVFGELPEMADPTSF